MKTRLAALCVVVLVAGCVAIPRATNELESARAAYRAAAANAAVQARAPVELQIAQRAMADAERFQKADADPALVAHFAYLAEQRARIAMKTAELRAAEAAVATSGEQHSRMQLDLSARERADSQARKLQADLARDEAQVLRQQAAGEKRMADERAAQHAAEMRRLQGEMSELKARETERGWVLTMRNDLLFDSGQATLKPGGHKALENLAAFMRLEPRREIAIEGFTDSSGSAEANRRLSEARAAAVKQALVSRGIEPHRIDARGFGPAFPVASNETAVGRQLNRRVEVVIAPERRASFGGATR
jgi:outer membrane protein OmpA-like peptidoglycan-associated protein